MWGAAGLAAALVCGGVAAAPVLEGRDVVAYFSLAPGDKGVLGSPQYVYNLTTFNFNTSRTLGPYVSARAPRARTLAWPAVCSASRPLCDVRDAVVVGTDAPLACSPFPSLLAGGCSPPSSAG